MLPWIITVFASASIFSVMFNHYKPINFNTLYHILSATHKSI